MSSTAAIHIAKKQLGLDDDTYRAICLRVTGKDSSAQMSERQRLMLLDDFRKRGFKPTSKAGRKRLEGKFAPKLQALWIAGWNLGVITNRSDEALIAFIKSQTGIDHVQFLHHLKDARTAIESLKKWIERKVGPLWAETSEMDSWRRSDAAKVAAAQWSLLSQQGRLPAPGGFQLYALNKVAKAGTVELADFSSSDWQTVMNALGREIRKVSK